MLAKKIIWSLGIALTLSLGWSGVAKTRVAGPRVWHRVNEEPRPSPRFGAGIVYDVARKEIVLQAGSQLSGTPNDTWVRRHTDWTLMPTVAAPSSPYGMGMVYDAARGETVLFGGLAYVDGMPTVTNETWIWNGNSWRKIDSPVGPSARAWSAMAYDAERREVVLFGGLKVDIINGSQALGETWVWNGSTWTQRDTPVAPAPRYLCGIDYDPIGKRTILFGGNFGTGQWSAETWSWDGNAWTKLSPANAPEARDVGAFGIDPRTGHGILFSGGALQGAFLDTWFWDGNNWTKLQPAHQPVTREFSRIIYDNDAEELILVYGWNGNASLRDIWTWTGTDWLEKTKPLEPSPRAYGNMCLDRQRNVVVLFGGLKCDVISGETWLWNGAQWQPRLPQNSPSARYGHALAFDEARGKLLLFGGQNADVLGDTWLWDGTNWSQATGLTITPPARHHANMAYDPVRNEVVLFGGEDSNGVLLGDTWVWNGTQWNLRVPIAAALPPTPRFRSAMAWDETNGAIIMFGGFDDPTGVLADTWSWNGSVWTQLNPATSPDAKYGHGMATDLVDGHPILFRSPDTWRWDGTNWEKIDNSPQAPSPRGGTYFASDPTGNGVTIFGGPSIGYRDDTWRLAPNNSPVAVDQSLSTGENSPLPIVLAATDSDGDLINYTVTSPAHGTLNGVPPKVTYVPANGFRGSDSFTFVANDGFADSNVATVQINVTAAPPLLSVVSTKTHGSSGTYDVDLTNGGVECRSGGANGDYTLVFNFANRLTNVTSVAVTNGIGSIATSAIGSDAHQFMVDVTGVTSGQVLTIAVSDAHDDQKNVGTVFAALPVLLGDTTQDRQVNSADISQTKSQSGQGLTSANFREDLSADGFINSADIALVKSKSGTALPNP